MQVIVTGSRDWPMSHAYIVMNALQRCKEAGMQLLVHGACPTGVDSMAHSWCKVEGFPMVAMPAWFETLGNAAGPKRNGWMLSTFPTAIVLAFPGASSRGTWDCVRQATDLGRTVHVCDDLLPEIPF